MSEVLSSISQIHYIFDRVFSAMEQSHAETPINAGQMRLLMSLWDKDGISIQELANRNSLKKNTVGAMLPKMEKEGYVTLAPSEEDGRSRKVFLTPLAAKMHESHAEILHASEQRLFVDVSDADEETFMRVLEKVKVNIQKIEEDNK